VKDFCLLQFTPGIFKIDVIRILLLESGQGFMVLRLLKSSCCSFGRDTQKRTLLQVHCYKCIQIYQPGLVEICWRTVRSVATLHLRLVVEIWSLNARMQQCTSYGQQELLVFSICQIDISNDVQGLPMRLQRVIWYTCLHIWLINWLSRCRYLW
jgi:hypothetical protein